MRERTQGSVRQDTFVLRVWRRHAADGARWRAKLERLQSQDMLEFSDLQSLLAYLAAGLAEAVPADAEDGARSLAAHGPSG